MTNYTIQDKPVHNPFNVPEGYFENFSSRLMQRIKSAAKESITTEVAITPTDQQWWIRKLPWWGAACILMLVLLFSQIMNLELPDTRTRSTLSNTNNLTIQSTNNASEADLAYDYMREYGNLYYDND